MSPEPTKNCADLRFRGFHTSTNGREELPHLRSVTLTAIVQDTGIEPVAVDWKSTMLPLHQSCKLT